MKVKKVKFEELPEKERLYYEKESKRVAKAVCAYGDCYAPYKCRHGNRVKNPVSRVGSSEICPLSKYKFSPVKSNNFFDYPRMDIHDLVKVCLCCDKPEILINDDGFVTVDREKCFNECLDCPIHACYENMLEGEAEARMS